MKPYVRAPQLPLLCMSVLFSALACSVVNASDALLLEQTIDLASGLGLDNFPTKTLYRSKSDPDQFYYHPTDVRLALDEDRRPIFIVYQYNLAYKDGRFQDLRESSERGEFYQRGTLKASFTCSLRDNELAILEEAIQREGLSRRPTISRLPLNEFQFTLVLSPTAKTERTSAPEIAIGPFHGDPTADHIHVQAPLTQVACDTLIEIIRRADTPVRIDATLRERFIALDADGDAQLSEQEFLRRYRGRPPVDAVDEFRRKDTDSSRSLSMREFADEPAPIQCLAALTYCGHGLVGRITTEGSWSRLYDSISDRLQVGRSYWHLADSPSFEAAKTRAMADADIDIEYDGEIPENLRDHFESCVMDKLLAVAFDQAGLEPSDSETSSDTGRTRAGVFGAPVRGNVGYGRKAVSRGKRGLIRIEDSSLLATIAREDLRVSTLDLPNVNLERNLVEVDPSTWDVSRITVRADNDLAPWLSERQSVTLEVDTGRTKQSIRNQVSLGKLTDFGPFPLRGDPIVGVSWMPTLKQQRFLSEERTDQARRLNSSWREASSAIGEFFRDTIDFETDLRLTSEITLSEAKLPIRPHLFTFTPTLIISDTEKYDVADSDRNDIILSLEQDIEGLPRPHTVRFGGIKLAGEITASDPMQAIVLTGPAVKSNKIVATIMLMNNDGKRMIDRDYTFETSRDLKTHPVLIYP